MRLILPSTLLLAIATSESSGKVYKPHRISFSDLVEEDFSAQFLDALTNVGMVAIHDIPGYVSNKNQALSSLHSCTTEASEAQKVTLKDGTIRRTLATRTVSGPGGAQRILKTSKNSCSDFIESSDNLRSAVDRATRAFANKLGLELQENENMAKIASLTTEDGSYDFQTFGDVVEYGDHLEHFHSYQREKTSINMEETIEFHTDQGLFIAFTPAMIADTSDKDKIVPAPDGGGFYIEHKDGTRASVDFQSDDLIIMLGDGVNQIVNKQKGRRQLRATPHALTVPNYDEGEVRVWHGRMVLPPSGAVHPEHGQTFGQMRKLMIEASTSNDLVEESLSLGCSSASDSARMLAEEEVICEAGTTYCWHRCMPHMDYNITTDICASRNLRLQCVNPREQVYLEGHGDFFPACSNSTEPETEYPKVPAYPRDEAICDDDTWNEFASTDGYEFAFDRLGDNQGKRGYWDGHEDKGMGKIAKFMWNVVDDSVIEGKVVFNGLFGYISAGFAKEGGKKNGMNGASVIMAIPGGNYSAKLGLDLGEGPSVEEYTISLSDSSFRHWSDPIEGRDTSSYKVESTPCFTSLTFATSNINDIPFNVTGADKLIWAANNMDTFCGSHGRGQDGRGDRDAFMVEWKTGKAWFPVEPEEEEIPLSDSSAMDNGFSGAVSFMFAVITAFFTIF